MVERGSDRCVPSPLAHEQAVECNECGEMNRKVEVRVCVEHLRILRGPAEQLERHHCY